MADTSNLIRREALRFLCERHALPHALTAITAGLRRAGVDTTQDLTTEALDYLTEKAWARRNPPAFGGGIAASTWKATASGKDQNDESP
ncbi:MAG: hypothetical protein V4726_11175 [Verrucomicrobiota bacterium]